MLKIIPGIERIIAHYQLVLIDAWGVLHDGGTVFPGALDLLERLSKSGLPVVVLSNAARRNRTFVEELERSGIPQQLIHSVQTSGELAWQYLSQCRPGHWKTGYYLGPERSRSLCDGLNCHWSGTVEESDFVLNTGAPKGNPVDTSPVESRIRRIADLKLPMLCANPDQVAVRAGVLGISAGAIAQRYIELGGPELIRVGKPDALIFETVMQRTGVTEKTKVLMIGDGLSTDIAGALNIGIDTVLISSGIHQADLEPLSIESLKRICMKFNVCPHYVCERAAW